MLGKTTFGCVLVIFSLTALAAWAQPSYPNIEQRLTVEQLHATGLDTLSPEQLALLNRLLREQPTQTGKTEIPHDEDEVSVGSYIGIDVKPINSRLKGSVSGWEPGTVFELENGQTWKVLKGKMTLREPLPAADVVLVPGIAGRWFLQVDEDLPKARVYRID